MKFSQAGFLCYRGVQYKIVEEAKARYSVRNEDGSINIGESDKPVSEAIRSGKIELTREKFNELRALKPPAPKEDIIRTLKAYEEKARTIMTEGD